MRNNFRGSPARHVASVDLVRRRLEARRPAQKGTAGDAIR
jgi:hypothetical protein